ncbi:MAG: radical SAM protein [Desulfobulbaceae bacterium]|nr:radical SAM protein [Desulfobulbaceae bacterium]
MAKKEKINDRYFESGRSLLPGRSRQATALLEHCMLCPRRCGVNRLQGETGFCGIGRKARIAAYGPHFGEESVLVGSTGSGAIFFGGCNLQCVFCQNEDISILHDHEGNIDAHGGDAGGEAVDGRQLAMIMLELQEKGCLNINLVTPSHVVPQILEALAEAAAMGLTLPLVYNTSAYDSVETLQLLDGIVDIYMPDCKFQRKESAARYLGAPDYPQVMQQAIVEMHSQVGDLICGRQGEAVRGLLVRHLVMPGLLEETAQIMQFLAHKVSSETFVNVMDQYRPCYRAAEFAELNRVLRPDEYEQAMEMARKAGLHRFEERDFGRLLALLKLDPR